MPAVALDSPLTEELGEPRPQATVVPFDAASFPSPAPDAAPAPQVSPEPRYNVRLIAGLVAAAVLALLLFVLWKVVPASNHTTTENVKQPVVAASAPAAAPAPAAGDAVQAAAATSGAEKIPIVAPSPPAPVRLIPEAPPEAEAPAPPRAALPKAEAKTVPRPTPKPVAAAASPSSPYLVQLASVPTAAAARRETARPEKRLDRVLDGSRISTVKAVDGARQTVYRLRVAGYGSLSAAKNACKRIRQQKVDCLVVKR